MADTATVHVGFITYGPDKDQPTPTVPPSPTPSSRPSPTPESPATPSKAKTKTSPPTGLSGRKANPRREGSAQFRSLKAGRSHQRRRRCQNTPRRNKSRRQPVRPDPLGPQGRKRLAGRSRRQGAPRARTVAGEMAKGLNANLGALLYASNETQAEPPRPLMRAMAPPPMASAQTIQPLAIDPRRIEKSATVYAVFAIE